MAGRNDTVRRWRHRQNTGPHYFPEGAPVKRSQPGDVVRCPTWMVEAMAWKFEALDPEPPPPEEIHPLEIITIGGGWYDVRHPVTKRNLNDRALRKADAYALARDLAPDVREQMEREDETLDMDEARTVYIEDNGDGDDRPE